MARMRPAILPMLFAMGALPAAARQEPAAQRHPAALVASARCGPEAMSVLQSWSADGGQALADPPGPAGTRSVRMPTRTFGTWVRLMVDPSYEISLERISTFSAEAHRFGPDCELHLDTRAVSPAPAPGAFTDARLSDRLAEGDTGIILLWSPHMPLSVDEYDELRDVAATLQIALVAVLDPVADPGYARRVARERGLPDAALAPLAGIELAFRGMTTHAPSVQVFAGGRLVGPVLYGYRDRQTARMSIAGVLAGAR